MGTNKFLPWDTNLLNIMSDYDYTSSSTRQNGAATGIATPTLYNKLFRQSSVMCAAIGQWLSSKGYNVDDSDVNALAAMFDMILTNNGGNISGDITFSGNITGNFVSQNNQLYSTAGTFTFIAPITGHYKVTVTGSGGGAGGTNSTASNAYCVAGGAGAGGTAIKTIQLTKNQEITVIVGAGGIGGASTNNGTDGNLSSFNANIIANGGKGSKSYSSNVSGFSEGADGGTATGGDINIVGGAGSPGTVCNSSHRGGVGGCSLIGRPTNSGAESLQPGKPQFGAGGSGSGSHNMTSVGGNGADGAVYIEW